jgi:methionine synthase II (cobalamin-independent)
MEDLKLKCMAIGSLPHLDVEKAMVCVEKNFSDIPFWPQLSKISKNEDMIYQFLENMPGISFNKEIEKVYFDNEKEEFYEQLEEFFTDYEMILDGNFDLLEKYKITTSLTFEKFLGLIKRLNSDYAKGQIVGPFTLATSLTDKSGKCAFYDETLRDVIVKTLSLKALWQIEKIKQTGAKPIIFIDEPSLSQLGTSAFITISKEDVISVIKEISDLIKENGAMSAIHCCGKCDWSMPIEAGVDIINLDAFFFAECLGTFSSKVNVFLKKGGKIAWGIVPTLDLEALETLTIDKLEKKFYNAINYLERKGIEREFILRNSLITPSCGAGILTVDLAEKAMSLTKELSERLLIDN